MPRSAHLGDNFAPLNQSQQSFVRLFPDLNFDISPFVELDQLFSKALQSHRACSSIADTGPCSSWHCQSCLGTSLPTGSQNDGDASESSYGACQEHSAEALS